MSVRNVKMSLYKIVYINLIINNIDKFKIKLNHFGINFVISFLNQ
jgi:hypothetical protein